MAPEKIPVFSQENKIYALGASSMGITKESSKTSALLFVWFLMALSCKSKMSDQNSTASSLPRDAVIFLDKTANISVQNELAYPEYVANLGTWKIDEAKTNLGRLHENLTLSNYPDLLPKIDSITDTIERATHILSIRTKIYLSDSGCGIIIYAELKRVNGDLAAKTNSVSMASSNPHCTALLPASKFGNEDWGLPKFNAAFIKIIRDLQ